MPDVTFKGGPLDGTTQYASQDIVNAGRAIFPIISPDYTCEDAEYTFSHENGRVVAWFADSKSFYIFATGAASLQNLTKRDRRFMARPAIR